MKGILFKPEMIQAIREGRKTVTRRIIKQKPLNGATGLKQHGDEWLWVMDDDICMGNVKDRIKPRYLIGETVYVKEAWRIINPIGKYIHNPYDFGIEYLSVNHEVKWWTDNGDIMNYPIDEKLRSPMFLPEKYARTLILIEDVSPERLQEITENEAIAEGIQSVTSLNGKHVQATWNERQSYKNLWDSINKPPYDWKANPFVWRIQFKVRQD